MILNKGLGDDGLRLLQADTVGQMAQNHIGDLRVQLLRAPDASMARPFPLGAGVPAPAVRSARVDSRQNGFHELLGDICR